MLVIDVFFSLLATLSPSGFSRMLKRCSSTETLEDTPEPKRQLFQSKDWCKYNKRFPFRSVIWQDGAPEHFQDAQDILCI